MISNAVPPLNDLFIDFYVNIKDNDWPDYAELLQLKEIPLSIINTIVESYCLPDDYDRPESRLDIICQNLGIDSIPTDAFNNEKVSEAEFVAFYNRIRSEHWPEVHKFLELDIKPFDIIEDIISNWETDSKQNNIIEDLKNITDSFVIQHAAVEMHNYFFWSTVDFYHRKPQVLDLVDHNHQRKSKFFDVLLGRQKYHRDLIFNKIDHEKNIVTYMSADESVSLSQCDQHNFIWPGEIIGADPSLTDTASIVVVDGVIVSLSQIIPVDIYNLTRYSLVCESQCENNFSFFTEKIIKPMLAKRLFLVSSGKFFLKNLRSFGFKTFDGIIDESYDLEYRLDYRTDLILEQANCLYNLDTSAVYVQAQSIIQHNFDLVMNRDWQKEMIDSVTAKINKTLL
jgi:hypothetical protein